MTKTRLQIFALALALSAVGSVSGLARVSGDAPDATLLDLADYRQWTRATKALVLIEYPSPGG